MRFKTGKAEFYPGNYSFYAVEKERRYEEKLRQYEKEQAKIEQLEKAAEQLRIWAYSGNDKTFKRAQSMEKRIERMRATDRPKKERKLEVRFGEREFRGDEVLSIKDLSKSFDGRTLFSRCGPGGGGGRAHRPAGGQRHRQVHPHQDYHGGGGARRGKNPPGSHGKDRLSAPDHPL